MSLDASIDNRAKETFDLKVEYGSIYDSNDNKEIRKMLAYNIALVEQLESIGLVKLNIIKRRMNEILEQHNDKSLYEQHISANKLIKENMKDKEPYEYITHLTTDTGKITVKYKSNRTNKEELITYKLFKVEDNENRLEKNLNTFIETREGMKKQGGKDLTKINKKISLLKQVLEKNSK